MNKGFWKSPFDEVRFHRDWQSAMLMAIVVHIFNKDWGPFGVLFILLGCAAYVLFQCYLRWKESPQ